MVDDEEIGRHGHLATRAVAKEIDFYPAGTWRPPTRLHLTETDAASSNTRLPAGSEPAKHPNGHRGPNGPSP